MYRVLIADDEQLMRDALRIMVTKVMGFEVVACVANGIDAVEYCKKNPVDIVFMDIIMPRMTGIEASKEILISNPAINIYVLSAYSNFEFAREALKMKINEYILKPVSVSKITRILENHNKCYGMSFKQSEILFSLLEENNYGEMYVTVPKVVEEIFTLCGLDTNQLQATFRRVAANIFRTSKCTEENEIDCELLFPITENMVKEKANMEFWLFKVMDFVFQKNGIDKYPVLNDVFQYIEKHIKENIGLSDIINECAISQGYLSRIFKIRFQVSVMEYIHMKKMMIAKEYLFFTKYSVAEIAFRMGYNESNYFGKVFKKYECITAFQYRRNGMDKIASGGSGMEGGENNE